MRMRACLGDGPPSSLLVLVPLQPTTPQSCHPRVEPSCETSSAEMKAESKEAVPINVHEKNAEHSQDPNKTQQTPPNTLSVTTPGSTLTPSRALAGFPGTSGHACSSRHRIGRSTAQMLTDKFKAVGLDVEMLSVVPWKELGGCSRSWGPLPL